MGLSGVTELDEAYREFAEDLLRDSESTGDPQQACFFSAYAELAAENGDCGDLTYTPARKEGVGGYQVDGYAVDVERAEVHLAICDFRSDTEIQSLNQSRIDQLFRRAERFVELALDPDFIVALEETSPAFEAAYPIYEVRDRIRRIRLIIFSNARFASRKKGVSARSLGELTFTHNVLDFTRFCDIRGSRYGFEPIEIDLAELNGEAIPCLPAYDGSSSYASYLVALPGELLAKVYGLYGARLLEQNVRTFLQARTKVNRGIIETIQYAPEMFFAYNNGLTATASEITTKKLEDGQTAIEAVKNLQIVNGGQTTASILYANDKNGADLTDIYVQMKLSVIDPEEIEQVVPKISRYANTQNRISESDFFAGHPFHLEMERLSRRMSAPQRAGAFVSTKWFYERARGQYRDQLAYGTPASRKRFQTEFPKDQVIGKTDLAKYMLSVDCKPHIVSQGAQRCFLYFAERIGDAWEADPSVFGEAYFKEVVARAILFRWTDSMVGRAEWYKSDRGYKANIVTYTISWLADHVAEMSRVIDTRRIWELQELPEDLRLALEHCAPLVAATIKAAPTSIKNVSEYCKREMCWTAVRGLRIEVPGDLSTWTVRAAGSGKQIGSGSPKEPPDVEADARLLKLRPQAAEIREFAASRGLLSPKSAAALDRLADSRPQFSRADRNALGHLLKRMADAGFSFLA